MIAYTYKIEATQEEITIWHSPNLDFTPKYALYDEESKEWVLAKWLSPNAVPIIRVYSTPPAHFHGKLFNPDKN